MKTGNNNDQLPNFKVDVQIKFQKLHHYPCNCRYTIMLYKYNGAVSSDGGLFLGFQRSASFTTVKRPWPPQSPHPTHPSTSPPPPPPNPTRKRKFMGPITGCAKIYNNFFLEFYNYRLHLEIKTQFNDYLKVKITK